MQKAIAKKQGDKTDDKDDAEEMDEAKHGKPDYLDFDKDGDKKEPMKKALKDKENKKDESAYDTDRMIEELNKVKKIMVQKKDNLFYLKQRWIDERKYEDFNDYRKIILEIFKDFPNTKVDKNFNITITGKDRIMIIKVGVSKIKLESLQKRGE